MSFLAIFRFLYSAVFAGIFFLALLRAGRLFCDCAVVVAVITGSGRRLWCAWCAWCAFFCRRGGICLYRSYRGCRGSRRSGGRGDLLSRLRSAFRRRCFISEKYVYIYCGRGSRGLSRHYRIRSRRLFRLYKEICKLRTYGLAVICLIAL